MDMAHRGATALVEHGGAASQPVQRQEAPGQAGERAPARNGQSRGTEDAVPSSEDERLARVRSLLAQRWVGPFNEAEIERIWESFGPRVLDVAERHQALWHACVDRGARLDELPAVRAIQARFRADVQDLTRTILRRNEAEAGAELMALGIDSDGEIDPAGSPMPVDMQDDYVAELQQRAGQLVAARGALAELREVPVGFREVVGNHASHWEPATFDPAQPPPLDHSSRFVPAHLRAAHQVHAWDEVMAHHQRLAQAIAILSADSPALYSAVSRENDDRLSGMAAADPAAARQAMAASLSELLGNIRATIPKIGTDLDDRDLVPLHDRLFAGEAGASGARWSRPTYQWAARDMLSKHARGQFWLSLGLGTLAAAGFVVAELATFGTATFFIAAGVGLAAGGALAGRGWEQWEDLDTAAGASAGDGGQLVTQGQADAAFTSAVIDSAFAFLDVIPAVRALRAATAARAAMDGLGAGVGHTVARTTRPTTRRLQPQQAENWSALRQGYIDKELTEVGVPPGYSRVERDGGTGLSRAVADDNRFAQIHVDGDGLIRPGATPSPRVSNSRLTARSVGQILDGKGLAQRPPHHQAHHVVPDEVVRKHPLMRAAYERGLFKPDGPENIALLAERRANGMVPDKVPGLSEGLPRHQGAHRLYSDRITDAADKLMQDLLRTYGAADRIPDAVLSKAAVRVREEAWKILKAWEGPHLE